MPSSFPSCLRLLALRPASQASAYQVTAEKMAAAFGRSTSPLPLYEFRLIAPDDPEMEAALARADVLIGSSVPTRVVAATRGALGLIQLTSAGVDHLLPLDWLPAGVELTSASGVHGPKVMEWAMMTLLMLHGHLPRYATAQRRHEWSPRESSTIAGRRLLVFGTGGIGKAVADAGRVLGLVVTGVNRGGAVAPGFQRVVPTLLAAEALGEADFVVLAMPLTPETRGMMDRDAFARMKPGAGFANFGRGPLVDQEALAAALESGHLGGAVIDVATPEPLPASSPLWAVPGLIITPHVSCDDPETYIDRTLDILVGNLHRRAAGLPLMNRIDRQRAY
ncbi:D-2-hydroxyacid dehydrogenase [Zavarzinia sp.]|uniref:D-2-hydroxyacid dehydrogenase n=1 Tax=Zavarzinia sp. TaxID=2027920 RepID=UPI003BB5C970